MYVGDKNKINVSSSRFAEFINNNNLYVDKTAFIEHVLKDPSNVLLFTRPRRTGKSLNMNTLATFLDCKQDTAHLFKGLYIESSETFNEINKYPVIYLNFKELRVNDYKWRFKHFLLEAASRYLEEAQFIPTLTDYFNDRDNYTTGAFLDLIKNIYSVYGVKPYVLIDEYDKILMDNVYAAEYETLRRWVTDIFDSALKDNPALAQCVLTGVTRISKESMFSGFNNLAVYDIFTNKTYDRDFSLTESEAQELLTTEALAAVKEWYNNIRVGKTKLYNIYSVMSYLHYGRVDNYWAKSGTLDMLIALMNKRRADNLLEMIENRNHFVITELQPRLSLKNIAQANLADSHYYSLAIQAGYLTFDVESEQDGIVPAMYRVYIPNLELQRVWRDFILEFVVEVPTADLRDIFKTIGDTDDFSMQLKDFIDFRLSYFDADKKEPEKMYHVFLFGMALGVGFTCTSNKESGFGRYDLLIAGDTFNAVLEFKRAGSANELMQKADEALRQIEKRKYYAGIANSNPIYKVGISCYKTECMVKTILH